MTESAEKNFPAYSHLPFVLGIVLGLSVALARLYGPAPLVMLVRFYVWLIRGTPLLVQLFLIFYGLPSAGIVLDAFTVAVIGFTLNIGAYSSEIIRATLAAIPKGQWEAAYSIGMNWPQVMWRVILPQAARIAVPPLSNTFISLVKDTSLAAAVTVPELFQAAQRVLKGVGLAMAAGSVTALIGPSGSGKSTLLRCVNLLERPDAGQLVLGGSELDFTRHLSRQSVLALRQQTGMVFQNFQLFPHMTVLENVMEGLVTVLKWPRERAVARALQLLDKVGLRHKAEAVPATLSGGQQQRVAIARALAPSPKVLLCDEPTSALDPELAQEVVAVLRQLASEGTTMLIATHDLRLAAQIAQQVIFLEAGEVVEAGSARQMFTTPKRARTFEYISTLTERLPESWSI